MFSNRNEGKKYYRIYLILKNIFNLKKTLPQFVSSSQLQTSLYKPSAVDQTRYHSDTGNGNLGTEIKYRFNFKHRWIVSKIDIYKER